MKDNYIAKEKIQKVISILKKEPITKTYDKKDCGDCTAMRVKPSMMMSRTSLINENPDGTDDLCIYLHGGLAIVQIGRVPNVNYLEQTAATYMVYEN